MLNVPIRIKNTFIYMTFTKQFLICSDSGILTKREYNEIISVLNINNVGYDENNRYGHYKDI